MICYLDDDLDGDRLIKQAAAHSHRLLSPRSIGTAGIHDALHFLRATREQVPILTRNASDFDALHKFAIGIDGQHEGLIIVYNEEHRAKNMDAGQIVRALSRLEAMNVPLRNQLVALNHYR